MTARSSILDRVRIALANREVVAHPGSFEGWRPFVHSGNPTEQFTEMFEAAGGEVVSFKTQGEASIAFLLESWHGGDSMKMQSLMNG